jgi:hypothetical protein
VIFAFLFIIPVLRERHVVEGEGRLRASWNILTRF